MVLLNAAHLPPGLPIGSPLASPAGWGGQLPPAHWERHAISMTLPPPPPSLLLAVRFHLGSRPLPPPKSLTAKLLPTVPVDGSPTP